MSRPESHTKETLSAAYVSAVIARAEQSLNVTNQSDYGVDGVVHEIERDEDGYNLTGTFFNFQLKATQKCEFKNEFVSYTMKARAYNKFSKWQNALPIVLIVYHLPDDSSLWFDLNSDRLKLRHCAYWRFMDVNDRVKSSKVVKIPKTHIFDEYAVQEILDIAKRAPRENINFDPF